MRWASIGLVALLAPAVAGAQSGLSPAPAASASAAGSAAAAPGSAALLGASASPPSLPAQPARELGSWEALVRAVQTGSVDLRVARHDIERAEANERTALAGALPTLTATGTGTHHLITREITTLDQGTGQVVQTQTPPTPVFAASLQLRQTVVNVRTWFGIGTAREGVRAAKLRLDDRQRLVLAQAANAVAAVASAEKTAELQRVGWAAALERATFVKKRVEGGVGRPIDAVRVEQDLLAARGAIVSGDEQVRRARESLGTVLGLSEAVGVAAALSLAEVERSLKEACAPAPLDERTDLRAARQDLLLASRAVDDVWLSFLPTLDLVSTATVQTKTVFNPNPETWTVQGFLTIPLWDGGLRYGQLRTAQASLAQARARADGTRIAAEVEQRQTERAVAVAQEAETLAQEARRLARTERELAEKSFLAGEGTSLDLIEATRRERSAEIDHAVRELETRRARIASLLASAACPL